MLPQPDPHVLTSNPQFALLFKDLTETRLAENGSSKCLDTKEVKEEEAFREVRVC